MALQVDTVWVEAARAGDPAALDAVAAEYLPLVYNLVRRALRHSSDVDDVVQDTMVQFVRGVGSLRDPQRLRAWLVAVTLNQIREHHRSARGLVVPTSFEERADIPDPRGEFVEHTLIQLDVSGQRRETQQAAQWLDPDHRELLALWWLEVSGHLTRAELVEALQADPHHVAVRVSRMKEQLDFARRVVRALSCTPRCYTLEEVAYDWTGETDSVWRKRFARHVRECPDCDAVASRGLIPPERLLAGLALLPLPAAYAAFRASSLIAQSHAPAPTVRQSHRGGSHRGGKGAGAKSTGAFLAKPVGIAVVAVGVLAVAAAAVVELQPKHQNAAISTTSTATVLATSGQASPSTVVIPTNSASPSAAATSAKPSLASTSAAARTSSAASRQTSAAATTSSAAAGTGSNSNTAAQQVLDVINQARQQAGLSPYTMSTDLINSASAHNTRMEDGCGLSHQCSGEAALGDRETAAGVQWTAAGENIGDGGPQADTQSAIAQMAVDLTNSMLAEKPPNDGHRQNILSSSFTEVGIAVTRDSSGTVWMTQDFAN